MLNFTIYKTITNKDLEHVGVNNPEEFAKWFAGQITKETGCNVSGQIIGGEVHLITADRNMERVSDALERRNLTHNF